MLIWFVYLLQLKMNIMQYAVERYNKRLAKELPFYDISVKKLPLKHFTNRKLLQELPFYDGSNITMNSRSL